MLWNGPVALWTAEGARGPDSSPFQGQRARRSSVTCSLAKRVSQLFPPQITLPPTRHGAEYIFSYVLTKYEYNEY